MWMMNQYDTSFSNNIFKGYFPSSILIYILRNPELYRHRDICFVRDIVNQIKPTRRLIAIKGEEYTSRDSISTYIEY